MQEVVRLDLMRGVQEWDMLFECAAALKSKAAKVINDGKDGELSLLPFLVAVLEAEGSPQSTTHIPHGRRGSSRGRQGHVRGEAQAGLSAKQEFKKGVSPFWGGPNGRKQHAEIQHRAWSRQETADTPNHNASRRPPMAAVTTAEKEPPLVGSLPSPTSSPSHRYLTKEIEETKDTEWTAPVANPKRTHKSPFFNTPAALHKKDNPTSTPPSTTKQKPRPPRGTISSLPIPPLSASRFGLIQEELASDPFRLLVAVTFLIRTRGTAAIPAFRELMARFPTPADLTAASPEDIISLIRPLGLSAVRCAAIQKYARTWLTRPPSKDKRYGVRNYPRLGDALHVHSGQEFGPEDEGSWASDSNAVEDTEQRGIGSAWEIGHFTSGPYAIDSWRIFCRDVLLGRAEDWKGKGATSPGFQPEWMRVLPLDKELRACLRWMWMQEGWFWDPVTGDREPLGEEMRRAVDEGRVGYDDTGGLVILDQNDQPGGVVDGIRAT